VRQNQRYGANVDEYGVFRGADEAQAAEIKKAVEDYLAMRVDSWMDAYMPEEKPKVTSAQIEDRGQLRLLLHPLGREQNRRL
jgi:hypothetical protein